MFQKPFYALFIMLGILFLVSCSPKQNSPSAQPNMANPASVHCEQNSGKLELSQDANGGVTGKCNFSDGSVCEEWAYFREECKPGDSLVTPEPKAASISTLRVVYFKDGHVMLWTEGEGVHPLAEASTEQVRISDDGQVVAYLGTNADGNFGLYSVNADGTAERLLIGQDNLMSMQPASQIISFDFGPDSHTLYFVTDQYDLQRLEAENTGPVSVFGPGEGGFFTFSPDQQWVVLYHPDELVLAHPDGSAARIAFQYPPDFKYTMMGPRIVWEADSSGFHLMSASGLQGQPGSMSEWFVPVSGEQVRQMSYAGPYGAELSPDGRSVVYLNFQNEPVDVHVVDRDGKDVAYGSYSSNTYPVVNFLGWAPDSQSFLLNLSTDDARLTDPYLCMVGKQPVKLTDTDYADQVTWVDAGRFLFVSSGSLHLQHSSGASVAVDNVSSSSFDFATISY